MQSMSERLKKLRIRQGRSPETGEVEKADTVSTLKQVATVIVRNGDKILMGKRNDNGRYTNPGGHMEDGEDPRDAAVRELKEEAGIEVEPEDLKHLATKDVITYTGKKMKIHAYMVESNAKPTSKNDPDEEVSKWEWIDIEDGLADEIKDNLHSPKNVALKELGLIKGPRPGEAGYTDSFTERVNARLFGFFEKSDKPFSGYNKNRHARSGGLNAKFREKYNRETGSNLQAPVTESNPTGKRAARRRSFCARMSGVKGPTSKDGKLTPKGAALKRWKCKSEFFVRADSKYYVMDLMKSSGGHKYIRKYMRGGQWVYVYHEAGQHGRRMEPAALEAIKRLAAAGHDHARNLVDSIEEHPQAKLDALRRLADSGHEPSKEHLKSLGINRDQEKLEEKLVPREVNPPDKMDRALTATDKQKMVQALKKEIADSTAHLARYQSEEIGRKVHPVISAASLTQELERATTLREGLDALGKIAEKLETAQGSTASQRPGALGTYGNLVYNKGLENLKATGLISAEYAEEHARTARSGVPQHKDMKGVEERAEVRRREKAERERREKAEREERERRELAEVHGSMAHHMATLAGGRMSAREIKEAHSALSAMFGKNMRKEDWPYDFSEHGYNVTLKSFSARGGRVHMDFKVLDRNGREVVRSWQRTWTKDGSVFDIHNDYLAVNSSSRGSDKPIGSLINQSQIDFIKEHFPRTGQITVYAALDVGGYNWANQGFSFQSQGTMREYQSMFKSYLARHGINLSQSEVAQFTLPCHFASFDTGKRVIREVAEIGLTAKQKEHGTLSGKPGGTRLTPAEISSGRTRRIECHLGKDFLLGKSWNGIIKASEMNDTNEAYKYFKNYETMRNGASSLFNEGVKSVTQRAALTVPSSARAVESAPPTGPPAARRRVVRPRNFSSWPSARQQQWFDSNQTNMSRAARIAARRVINDTRTREGASGR